MKSANASQKSQPPILQLLYTCKIAKHMSHPSKTFASLSLCTSLFILNTLGSPLHATPPNIVFILADDLGITDINAYARHFTDAKPDELFYETPHLDKLVADSISFSQSYSNQLCSPTRAAILTGRIASTLGVTTATPNTQTYFNQNQKPPADFSPHDVISHKDPIKGKRPWINATSNTSIDPSMPTWPKVLKTHDCAFLGKWHLGGHGVPELQPPTASRNLPTSIRAAHPTSNGKPFGTNPNLTSKHNPENSASAGQGSQPAKNT
jgi:arylsulfatase A-like enzyme